MTAAITESAVDSLRPVVTADATRDRMRWWGMAAGLTLGAVDTVLIRALGVTFAMNGHDAGWLVAAFFGSSFALLGFLIGYVADGRRRDRRAAQVIQAQMETINAARTRLVQSEKLAALGQLSATIAHEVRNPLAVIRSAAQSLAETLPAGDAEAHRACSFITQEIDRLTSVTGSLLAFARPLKLAERPVAVRALFDGALLLASDELRAKDVRIARREPADLPPVRADEDLIRQVLLGLLSNAAEAVPRGGEVALAARTAGDAVELEVADSGPGVPREIRSRIFEPFFTTRSRGTGLGLAVARHIVEAHGGRIEVGEHAGGGARFTVRLRAARGAAIAA
jgi:signal transduction histidine kinase